MRALLWTEKSISSAMALLWRNYRAVGKLSHEEMKYFCHGHPVSKMMADGLSHGPGYAVLLHFGSEDLSCCPYRTVTQQQIALTQLVLGCC